MFAESAKVDEILCAPCGGPEERAGRFSYPGGVLVVRRSLLLFLLLLGASSSARAEEKRAPAGAATVSGRVLMYEPKPGASVSLHAVPIPGSYSSFHRALMHPAAQATLVRAWRGDAVPLSRTVATPSGEFAFDGVGPGLHVVRFEDGEGASRVALVDVPLLGGDLHVELQGRHGGPIVPGAVKSSHHEKRTWIVLLVEGNEWGIPGPTARVYGPVETDEEGRFALPHPPPGEYVTVLVRADAREWFVRPTSIPHAGDLILDLPTRGRAVRGVIRSEDKRALGGAEALFHAQYQPGPGGAHGLVSSLSIAATADEEGRYAVDLPDDSMTVQVFPRSGTTWTQSVSREASKIDLAGRGGGVLEIRTVRDEDGAVVEGVQVCVSRLPEDGLALLRIGRSDPQGLVKLSDLPSGTYSVWPCSRTHAAQPEPAKRGIEPPPLRAEVFANRKQEAELAVHEASTLICEVVDARGMPQSGVMVRAWDAAWMSWLPGTRPHRTMRTDAKGRVAMRGFARGTELVVTARRNDGALAQNKRVVLDGTLVRLTFEPARWMEVEVVAEDGAALPEDAWVRWGGMGWGRTRHQPTGSGFVIDGRARIGPLAPGELSVEAGATGFLPVVEFLRDAPKTTEDNPLRLTLAREKTISGTVVLPQGVAARNVELTQRGGPQTWFRENRVLELDDKGRFEFGGLRNQTLEFEAFAARGGRAWVGHAQAIAGAKDVKVLLDELHPEVGSGVWFLRVRDADGEDVRQFVASVGALPRGGREAPSSPYLRMRQRRGLAVAWGKNEDKHTFFCVERAYAETGEPLRTAEVVVGPKTEAGGIIDVALKPERVLRGRLVDADGKSMANWGVDIARYLDEFKPRLSGYSANRGRTTTDDNGYFTFGGLGRFRYRLTAMPDEGGTGLMKDVAEDEDTVIWTVPAKSVARVRVLDSAGRPVAGARVGAVDEGMRFFRRRYWQDLRSGPFFGGSETDRDGVAELSGVETGKEYSLLVRPPDSREDLSGTAQPFDPSKPTEVRLPPGRTIRGRVTTPDGTALCGVSVACDIGAGELRTSTDLKDGRFELRAVPMRSVALWAHLTEPDRSGPKKRAGPDAGDVLLTAEPGRQVAVHIDRWDTVEGRLARWVPLPGGSRRRREAVLRLTSLDAAVPYSATARAGDDGVVRFHGVPDAARFAFWGGTTEEGEYVYLPNLAPSHHLVPAHLQVGRTVRGRADVPDDVVLDRVVLELAGASVIGAVQSDASFQIRGVPPGDARVVAWGRPRDKPALEFDVEGAPMNLLAEDVFRGEVRVPQGDIVVRLEPMAKPGSTDPLAVRVMEILAETTRQDAYKDHQARINRLVELGIGAKPYLFQAVRAVRRPGRHDPRAQAASAALAKLVTKDDLPQIASLLKQGYTSIASCLWELRSPDAMRAIAAAVRAGHFNHDIANAIGAQEPTAEATAAVRAWLRERARRRLPSGGGLKDAAEYLGRVGDYESIEVVEAAIGTLPRGHQRSVVAWALAALGSSRAVEELVEVLDDQDTSQYAIQERRRAAGTLQMIMDSEPFPGDRFFFSRDIDEAVIKKGIVVWRERVGPKLRFDRKARRWIVEGDQATEADLQGMSGAKEVRSLRLDVSAPKEVEKGETFKATVTVHNTGSVALRNVTVRLSVGERFSGAGRGAANTVLERLEPGATDTFAKEFSFESPGYYGVDAYAWDRERMVSAAYFRVAVLPEPDGSYPAQDGASRAWAAATYSGTLRVRLHAPGELRVGQKARFLLEVVNESTFPIKDFAVQLFAPPVMRGADGAQRRTRIPTLRAGERHVVWIPLTPTRAGEHSVQVRVLGSERRVSASCRLEFVVDDE